MKIPQTCPYCHMRVNTLFAEDVLDEIYDERKIRSSQLEPGSFGDKYCPRCGESLFVECAACDGAGYLLKQRPALFCTRCGKQIRPEGQVKVVCWACSGKRGIWMSTFMHTCAKKT